jgi:ABC-type dipeptide/oligopeptide/nickel transport system ATPase component
MVTVLVLTLIFCLGTAQAAVQEKNASVEKSFEKAVSSSLKEVGANGSLVSFTRRHLDRALPSNEFVPVPGTQPLPHELPQGCLYSDRCPTVGQN